MPGPWVVTGTGLITAAGGTPSALLDALVAGVPLGAFRAEDGLAAAEILDFDAKRHLQRKGVRDFSRISQLACAAAVGNAAGLGGVPAEEIGVVLGTAWGSLSTVIEFERQAHVQGPRFVDPILFTETVSNVPAGQVAIFFGWSAFNATVSAGSASGLAGVQRALEFLHEGRGAVAVAGGADELNPRVLRSLRGRGVVSRRESSLPLDAARSGRVGGEGACFLTLESEDHALRRGARIAARIRATAARFFSPQASADTSEHGSMAGLIRETLLRSGLAPEDVDAVILSSSGDPGGDLEEARAVVEVFGEAPGAPPVVVPKAILGETWGASGALAAVVAIEAIRSSTLPGAPRGFAPDPRIAGLHVPASPSRRPVRNVFVLDRAEQGHELGLIVSQGDRDGAGA